MDKIYLRHWIALFAILIALLQGCDKQESVAYPAVQYSEFVDLHVKSRWLYQMDSTVLKAFGVDTVVHHYFEKDSIISTFLDGMGQQSFRVYRYLTPDTINVAWSFLNAYVLTLADEGLQEIDENNYRYIRLVTPVSNGYQWDGNAYFTKNTTVDSDSSIAYLFGWNYVYANNNATLTMNTSLYDSTVTVNQVNKANGDVDTRYYWDRTAASEIYAKHIGLIYKKILYLEWQPGYNNGSGGYTSTSYGIEKQMIRH